MRAFRDNVRVRPRSAGGHRSWLAAGLLVAGLLAGCAVAHPCDGGRTCIPQAGISLELAPGWQRMTPKSSENMFVAGLNGSESGPGVMLKDGQKLLDSEPADMDELETAALEARSGVNNLLAGSGQAEAEQIDLPIGPAVRVRYVTSAFLVGNYTSVDYWFYSGDRLLVLMYLAGPTGGFPADSPSDLNAMAQSIRLLE
jgi:hypothetical protein